ncbi:MAG: UDP-N-acetylglucosamine 2-epimerase (non-hydrolyzing) [Fimbriimonadia bacterium]|jgi:UDP-N-acetylglucosamine 2-epimerase (non-hydrolysing)
MKVMTILGTRPEIIRLCVIIEKLDALCEQVVLHTGQNYDPNLDEVFFRQLGVRKADHYLGARGSFGEQIGTILAGAERLMLEERPDKFLVLGDTNSSMAAIMAKRLGISVYHMEAGNRCYDDRVPEEVNRRIIDHCSDVLMPYTERSRQNLLREGIAGERIYVTGNPIYEVLQRYRSGIEASDILVRLDLRPDEFFLVTMHRAENVDVEHRLRNLAIAFDRLQREHGVPVIVSTHPRTRKRMQEFGLAEDNPNIRWLEPFPFFEFVKLEQSAMCVLTDSGTVQEECSILKVPNVTIRDVTERPETVECGSNILTGAIPEVIEDAVRVALQSVRSWSPPPEYVVPNVSDTVVKIVLGYDRHFGE